MKTLQYRLKIIRQDKALTQAQLAKKSYLSKNTISNIERGITKNLKPDEIKLLSNALLIFYLVNLMTVIRIGMT